MDTWEIAGAGAFVGIFIGIWIAWLLSIWGNRKKRLYGVGAIYKSWRFGK